MNERYGIGPGVTKGDVFYKSAPQYFPGITREQLVWTIEHSEEIRAGKLPKVKAVQPPSIPFNSPQLKVVPDFLKTKYYALGCEPKVLEFAFEAWRYSIY